MKLSEVLFALICVLIEDHLAVSVTVQPEPIPAVGDIYFKPQGDQQSGLHSHKVQVYLPQSLQGLPLGQWGEICLEGSGDSRSIGTVICRQFGYTSGKLVAPPILASSPTPIPESKTDVNIWLRGVNCGPPPPSVQHILRCKYDNVTSDGSGCTSAYINCDDNKLTANPYQGQAYLCPPQDFYKQNRSTSTGLILLYLHHSWGTINYKIPIAAGSNEMDTLCRQLGFTRSNFQIQLPSYNYSHCYQADDPALPSATGVWMTADQFKCGESKACSGCCYRYPPTTSDIVPMKQADLQLSCTFDLETRVQYTEGNSFLCVFNDTKNHAELKSPACAVKGDSSSENNMIIIIVGSVLGATTLISLLVALTGCICYVRVKRRQRHNEGQPLLQGQAQPRQPLHNLQNNDEAGN